MLNPCLSQNASKTLNKALTRTELRVENHKRITSFSYRSPVGKFLVVQSSLDVGVYQLIETMCPQLLRENRD